MRKGCTASSRETNSLWVRPIEVMKPDGRNLSVTVKRIVNEEGEEQKSAPHPKQVLYLDLGMDLDQYDILRRKE